MSQSTLAIVSVHRNDSLYSVVQLNLDVHCKVLEEVSMAGSAIAVTDTNFEAEVLQASQPVLLYFWADWCGPCRLVSPSVSWAALHYGDRLKVVKLEMDQNPHAVAQYQIQGVPALALRCGERLLFSHEGAISRDKLVALLDQHLG